VEYFVSYYDYYQPEAYISTTDTYIEKDAVVNDDIDRLRHAATASLLGRRDVIIVASVSCIYGLGSPDEYQERLAILKVGGETAGGRDGLLRSLVDIQYRRNDTALGRGRFRARGDVIELQPAYMETAYRVSLFGDEVESITHYDPLTGEVLGKLDELVIYPATHYVTDPVTIDRATQEIMREMEECAHRFEQDGKLLEAHRIRQRTEYDLEMLRELGYCNGVENYSRIFEGRPPGSAPFTLMASRATNYTRRLGRSRKRARRYSG
jgi:excinuclease ABC subunit B